MNWKSAFWGLMLLCGCTQAPPVPAPSSALPATATPQADFTKLRPGSTEKISGAPFVGMSRSLAKVPGAAARPGSWVPLMEAAHPDRVVLLHLSGLSPEEADKRPGHTLVVTGSFKNFEDAGLVSAFEKQLGAQLMKIQDKPVYLEVSDDPWGGATPKPEETPISGP